MDEHKSDVAIIGIIVQNRDSAMRLNGILHDYSDFVIGRMGLPYRQRNLSIIAVAVDAPRDVMNALSGKLGKLPGVSVKVAYARMQNDEVS